MLLRRRRHEQFSNSESEKEHLKKKELKRKHPVLFESIDVNSDFEKIDVQLAVIFFPFNYSSEILKLPSTRTTDGANIENDDWNSVIIPILPEELLSSYSTNQESSLIFGQMTSKLYRSVESISAKIERFFLL